MAVTEEPKPRERVEAFMYTGTIKLWREDKTPRANVPWRLKYHSPDGYEWGYSGSGPADLALNILHCLLSDDPEKIDLPYGQKASAKAMHMHQEFKQAFLTPLPFEGGEIKVAAIEEWIRKQDEGT